MECRESTLAVVSAVVSPFIAPSKLLLETTVWELASMTLEVPWPQPMRKEAGA